MTDDILDRIRDTLDYSVPVDISHVLLSLAGDFGDMRIGRWMPSVAADYADTHTHPATVAELTAARGTPSGSRENYALEDGRAEDRLNAIWDAVYGPEDPSEPLPAAKTLPVSDPDGHDGYALFRQMLAAATERTRADRDHAAQAGRPGATETRIGEVRFTAPEPDLLTRDALHAVITEAIEGYTARLTETINRAAGASVYEVAPPVTYEDIAQALNATWRDTRWIEAPDLIDYIDYALATARRRLIDGATHA